MGDVTDVLKVIKKDADYYDRIAENTHITGELVRRNLAFDSPADYSARRIPRLKARLSVLFRDVAHKRVLVYGCGNDCAALWFARYGATVDAIDISPESVKNQEVMARIAGLSVNAMICDAQQTGLPSEQYDIIYGNAILHHLAIEKAAQEICRLLKPGGIAVFRDNMRGNVFLQMFRYLTPFWRTPDEHPLTESDLGHLAKEFSSIIVNYYMLSGLPYHVFTRVVNNVILPRLGSRARVPRPEALYAMCDKLDNDLFRLFPFLKKQAWLCLVELSK